MRVREVGVGAGVCGALVCLVPSAVVATDLYLLHPDQVLYFSRPYHLFLAAAIAATIGLMGAVAFALSGWLLRQRLREMGRSGWLMAGVASATLLMVSVYAEWWTPLMDVMAPWFADSIFTVIPIWLAFAVGSCLVGQGLTARLLR